VINKGNKTNGNEELDIYLWGFGDEDVISLDGFGQITPLGVDGAGDPTMRTITFNDGAVDWTVNLHAKGGTNGFDDDFLLLDRSALGA
jgi:hypothetical protein